MRLVYDAMDLRDAGSTYFLDACQAIVDYWTGGMPERLETKWRQERLIQLLRRTE